MNDAEVERLLAGIDAPRPLPSSLRDDLLATLTDATKLATADAPRPLPDDLRHRLEATLIPAIARPVPRSLRRRVLASTSRPTPRILGAVAAVLLVFVAGLVVASRPDNAKSDQAASGPQNRSTTTAPSAAATGTGGGTSSGFSADEVGGSGPAAPTAGGAGQTAAATEGRLAAPPIQITVTGRDGTDIATGFNAYLATVNAAGGINGRPLTTIESPGGVANVNFGSEVTTGTSASDVVFDSVWYPQNYLSGSKVSLSSPFERQARLAVDSAYPTRDTSARVALYASSTAPWNTLVSGAFEDALKSRGVTVIKVAFNAGTPAYVPGVDAAFLALSPRDASAWVQGATRPAHGVWAMGSAFDDRLAPKGETLGLHVLSPYRPVDGDEATVLRNALPDHALTVTAVHGWVTAKAVVELLRRNGGAKLTTKDLAGLVGWDPQWAPPYTTRSGGRDRTPEAILLVPKDGRFVAQGPFLRDG